jgi:hypothetical protein
LHARFDLAALDIERIETCGKRLLRIGVASGRQMPIDVIETAGRIQSRADGDQIGGVSALTDRLPISGSARIPVLRAPRMRRMPCAPARGCSSSGTIPHR